jgi:hypothetical protein
MSLKVKFPFEKTKTLDGDDVGSINDCPNEVAIGNIKRAVG